jgi:hypothetical protein
MRSSFKFAGGEFRPNVHLSKDLRRGRTLDPALDDLAKLGALGAREIAFRVAYDSGDYFRSIHGGLGVGVRSGLPVGRISATDHKANWVESGHRKVTRDHRVIGVVRGRRVLQRGARRAGLRVRSRKRVF